MKAISLWEPWASLMMLGAKTIETRSWPTKHRGPLLICAAQGGLTIRELRMFLNEWTFRDALKSLSCGDLQTGDLNFGRAICIVDVVDCLPIGSDLFSIEKESPEYQFGDYSAGRFAWITKNLRAIAAPFAIKGGQRIFNVPDDVMRGVLTLPVEVTP